MGLEGAEPRPSASSPPSLAWLPKLPSSPPPSPSFLPGGRETCGQGESYRVGHNCKYPVGCRPGISLQCSSLSVSITVGQLLFGWALLPPWVPLLPSALHAAVSPASVIVYMGRGGWQGFFSPPALPPLTAAAEETPSGVAVDFPSAPAPPHCCWRFHLPKMCDLFPNGREKRG